MHILFVEPGFPHNQGQFVKGLAAVGAEVTGIGEAPPQALSSGVQRALSGYEQVSSVCDEKAMIDAVRKVQDRAWVDRLEATIEAHILPVAHVRAAAKIPGTSIETAFLCRDKPAMKDFLRKHGVPCAMSQGVNSAAEVRHFAQSVGFPIILKPPDGAGAADTEKIDTVDELEQAILEHGLHHGRTVAAEEYIEGHEGFYDTLTIDGEVAHEYISHYYPGVLDAMRHRWISPYIITTNRSDAPGYDEVKAMGKKVIRHLGIGTSATHMEWFFGNKGLKFSEIGCRPPGVGTWDLYSAGNELDLYEEWAASIVHGRVKSVPSRRFSAGMISLRPSQDGKIVGYQGMEEIQKAFGDWVIDSHFPPPGTSTQPVEAGYMANAWIRLKHPDYDQLREMLETVGRTIKVLAG